MAELECEDTKGSSITVMESMQALEDDIDGLEVCMNM